ncbi:hypothetical protein AOPFMNJM_0795 [Methylobacterium jeotgali]|uniref:Caspase family p20 domain-containing protein n=4 Tax=Pseudomonadota TaxID=1224 RepID=A0ABQ4SUC6_9HYPH|nr:MULTISPECIES: caspase domain-containing protein [Methylobacterium]GBU17301.1 hypothetical protein AwMethylo_15160 [Methylobacterium sp.]GJE05495.1 hypothetical protein AOPFMNJM_0795 [Methylobacterium jeotgali]
MPIPRMNGLRARPIRGWLPALLLTIAATLGCGAPRAQAQGPEKRIALVIGNAAYTGAPLATPANDAGLVAQTLQAAGFDVAGARDLDEDGLRRALRDFVDKAAASGPDTVAFLYLSGYGLQLDGENYFAPVDARIERAADVAAAAVRVSDFTKRLAGLPLKARFVVLDAGRANPYARSGDPLAGGLALVEADPGSLVAFNAAPGTVGPESKGPYGAYAEALVEMIREGGLQPEALFERVRLRVNERTAGGEVPWHASRIETPFVFLERAADAPAVAQPATTASLRGRPLREIGARDAYALCLERDTLQGYQDFLAAYPQDALAARVRAILAARREALTWRRTLAAGSPEAYWSYLGRYPKGPHAAEARHRLARLAAALQPPPAFTPIVYDVPPPPVEEIVYVDRPVVTFDDPVYAFAPPPPPPVVLLPPPPAYIVALAPPPPPVEVYALPVPAFVPMAAYVSAPAYISPPPNNVIFQNIHNTTVINAINAGAANPGAAQSIGGPSTAAVVGAGALGATAGITAAKIALPPSVAQKAALPANAPGAAQSGAGGFHPGQPLPGQAPAPGFPAKATPLPGQLPAQALPSKAATLPNATVPNAVQPGGKPGAPASAASPLPQGVKPGLAPLPQPAAAKPATPPAGQGPGLAPAQKGPPPAAAPAPAVAAKAAPPAAAAPVPSGARLQAARQQNLAGQRQAEIEARNAQRQQAMAAQRAAAMQRQAAGAEARARQMQAQAARQQAMAQQRQAQQAQMQAMRQQQSMQRQQAMQQRAMQRQQMMQQRAAPPPRAPAPHGGTRCPPGMHCR